MDENRPDEINLMDYVQVIRKRKWLILVGTLVCMVGAGVISLTMPKVYEAKAYLMVTSPKYQVEFAAKEGPKISTPLFENISAETFSKIILNEHTARAVITKLKLDLPPLQRSVRELLGNIRVEYPRNTNLILLRAQDTSKDLAAQIANAWATAFIERNEEVISKDSSNTYEFVMGQLEKVKVSLKTVEEELESFQKANRIDLLKEQIAGKIKQIVQYESRLDDAIRSQLVEKARYSELISQILSDMKLKMEDLEIRLEKQRIGLEKTTQELQKENRSIPVDKGLIGKEEINPIYVNLGAKRADIAIDISLLEKEREELLRLQENLKQFKPSGDMIPGNQRVTAYTNITYKELKDAFMKAEINIQSLNAEIPQLKENIKQLNNEVGRLKKDLAQQELILSRLVRNVDTTKSTFEILSRKGEETKVSSAIKATTIQVSVPAQVPEFPVKPKKKQNVMIAGMIGLLASILMAFFTEAFQRKT